MKDQAKAVAKRKPIFYGWVIVALGFLAEFTYSIGSSYVFGVFLKPMSTDFGWTRAATASALSLSRIFGGLAGLVVGPLIDRKHGARLIMVFGTVVATSGFVALGQMQSMWEYYLIFALIGALGIAEFGGLVSGTIVAKWFVRKRGRAVAIVISGVTIGGTLFATVSEYLVSTFGWRTAWVLLGLVISALLLVPVALFMKRRPEDMGLTVDGDAVLPKEKPAAKPQSPRSASETPVIERSWTLKETMGASTFWVVVAAFTISGLSLSAIPMHQVAYMTDMGFSDGLAATSVSVMAGCSAIGKLFWGFVSERMPIRRCTLICFVAAAGAITLLMNARTAPLLVISAAVYGLSMGGSTLLTTLVYASYFGRGSLGSIRGVVAPFSMLSLAGGPILAGYVYDVTLSYQISFTIFVAGWVLGALLIFFARPPRLPGQQPDLRPDLAIGR